MFYVEKFHSNSNCWYIFNVLQWQSILWLLAMKLKLVINKSDLINTAYASSFINLAENNESIYKWKVQINYFNPEMWEVDWGWRMGPKVAKIFIGIDYKWKKESVHSAPNHSVGGDVGCFYGIEKLLQDLDGIFLELIYD